MWLTQSSRRLSLVHTVTIAKGVCRERLTIAGGSPGLPITIRSLVPHEAVLDGARNRLAAPAREEEDALALPTLGLAGAGGGTAGGSGCSSVNGGS